MGTVYARARLVSISKTLEVARSKLAMGPVPWTEVARRCVRVYFPRGAVIGFM
jgi:hypothetical protein